MCGAFLAGVIYLELSWFILISCLVFIFHGKDGNPVRTGDVFPSTSVSCGDMPM